MLYFGTLSFFKREIKKFINNEYGETFPYLKVITDKNIEFYGKIIDVFNEKVIILIHKNSEKIVSWDSVLSLEINCNKNYEDTQKHLYDYL